MPDRQQRSVEDLRKASDHVFYEFSMLQATVLLVSQPGHDDATRNAYLESFTIHARALLQFFFPTDPRPDDVLASDFFQDQPGRWALAPLPAALSTVNRRVGKEIAHISYLRTLIGPEAKGWKVWDIRNALGALVESFVEAVDRDRLGARWTAPVRWQTPTPVGPYFPLETHTAKTTPDSVRSSALGPSHSYDLPANIPNTPGEPPNESG